MKVGTVKLSQVGQYNRMDAGFHLAINDIAEDLAEFRAKDISPDACKSQLKNLPLYAYEPLKPLLRSQQKLNRETATKAIEEYPLEAWLLVKKGISTANDILCDKAKEIDRERKALSRFL